MKDNKKFIIGIIAILILVISATYAYFGDIGTNTFTTVSIAGSTDEIGSVSLTSNSNLTMSVTNLQMMDKGSDVVYYSSTTGTKIADSLGNVVTTPIGTATALGNGKFICNYTLTIDDSANSLYDVFQSNANTNKQAGQVILRIDGVDYDFSTSSLFPITHTGKIKGVTEGYPKTIDAALIIVNKTGSDQSALAESSITLTFTPGTFSCDVAGEGGKYILANNSLKTNLSATKTNDLLGTSTLYRYQGTYTNVTNNYICFNTYDKDLCVNNPNTYMYRILGIAEDGTMKLIKHAALSSTRRWHTASAEASCTGTTCDWEHSALYSGINGSYFLSTLNTGWSDKIQSVNWKYGDITTNSGYSAESSFTRENAFSNQVNAKIGLMYIYDYFYANNWDGTQNYGTAESPVRYGTDGWIHRSHTDNNVPNNWEWLLSRYGLDSDGHYYAWRVYPDGYVSYSWLGNSYSVRPVFYLESNVSISGEGTTSNPYVIN